MGGLVFSTQPPLAGKHLVLALHFVPSEKRASGLSTRSNQGGDPHPHLSAMACGTFFVNPARRTKSRAWTRRFPASCGESAPKPSAEGVSLGPFRQRT